MDMESFLRVAKAYDDLGWSVREQLHDLDKGGDPSEQNPNALKMITRFLDFAAKHGVEGTDIILDAIREAEFDD